MLDLKKFVLGTLAYAAITFPLAYVWHLVAFKTTYEKLGYFSREEPIVVFGFFAILLQGALLSLIYPFLCRGMSFGKGAITIALVMGGYHWAMHVLAAAAKQAIEPLPLWFGFETTYLAIQFSLAGLLLGAVYRKPSQTRTNLSVFKWFPREYVAGFQCFSRGNHLTQISYLV